MLEAVGKSGLCHRTMQMCLLWVLPTRDLLPLLRQKPTLYHRAVQQAVPSMAFDYLAINPIGVSHQPPGKEPVASGLISSHKVTSAIWSRLDWCCAGLVPPSADIMGQQQLSDVAAESMQHSTFHAHVKALRLVF